MKKTALLVLLLSCFIVFVGCKPSKQPYLVKSSTESTSSLQTTGDDDEINATFDTSLIYPGITLGEVSELLNGQSIPSGKSVNYPIYRSWSIGNEKVLEIGFCAVGGLPFESPTESNHIITEEEAALLKDWYDGFKAISAYILENGKVETVLFEEE